MKKGYIICPVRNVTPDTQSRIDNYIEQMAQTGWELHNPRYDAPQDDPTGVGIYQAHLPAILAAERIFIFWDVRSFGSHVDLGIAMGLGKPITLVEELQPDLPGKSFAKIIRDLENNGPLVRNGQMARPASGAGPGPSAKQAPHATRKLAYKLG